MSASAKHRLIRQLPEKYHMIQWSLQGNQKFPLTSLVYRASSRTDRAAQRNSVSRTPFLPPTPHQKKKKMILSILPHLNVLGLATILLVDM
jgi:hypothetical protein